MQVSIADTTLTLPQSAALIAHPDSWGELVTIISSKASKSDRWQPADLDKPFTIAEVRALQHFASSTAVGGIKVAFLPYADQLRAETANALLKLLEEPPDYLYLVLLAETAHFLPTIRSRVQCLSLLSGSATIGQESSGTRVGQWQNSLRTFNVQDPKERRQAYHLLFLHPLVHQTIKVETILEAYRKS